MQSSPVNRISNSDSERKPEVDATSGATDWAHAFAAQDPGTSPAPPAALPPGSVPARLGAADCAGASTDADTGATPGVASACRDLGMQSVERVVQERGIKPPGVA